MTTQSQGVLLAKPTFLKLAEDKRQQIRDAALDEFSQHPYSLASISKIVRDAGISKGSVYQ